MHTIILHHTTFITAYKDARKEEKEKGEKERERERERESKIERLDMEDSRTDKDR